MNHRSDKCTVDQPLRSRARSKKRRNHPILDHDEVRRTAMHFISPGSLSKGCHDACSKRAHCSDIGWCKPTISSESIAINISSVRYTLQRSRERGKDYGDPFDPKIDRYNCLQSWRWKWILTMCHLQSSKPIDFYRGTQGLHSRGFQM